MAVTFFSLFWVLLLVAVNLALPVCIAVFVYRDAKKRGLEPLLWALVAALVPSFIGLIIYLIVRSGHSSLHCARCGAPVEEQYAVCPQCGAELKSRCPSCGRYVQPDWQLCAYCSEPLPGGQMPAVVEQSSSNKGLWIVLAVCAVAILLLLLLLLVDGYGLFFPSGKWPGAGQMHHMRYMHHL